MTQNPSSTALQRARMSPTRQRTTACQHGADRKVRSLNDCADTVCTIAGDPTCTAVHIVRQEHFFNSVLDKPRSEYGLAGSSHVAVLAAGALRGHHSRLQPTTAGQSVGYAIESDAIRSRIACADLTAGAQAAEAAQQLNLSLCSRSSAITSARSRFLELNSA